MFTKIHYAYYNWLFELYGKLVNHYLRKIKKSEIRSHRLERKLRRCIDDRDDILDILATIKGLN